MCKILLVALCQIQFVASFHLWTIADVKQSTHSLAHPHVVDDAHHNVLLRIGNPAVYSLGTGPNISTSLLMEKLRETSGIFYPTGSHDLIDVSLMDESLEGNLIGAERDVFLDQFVHWPTYGISTNDFNEACAKCGLSCPRSMQPALMTDEARRCLASNFRRWDSNELDARVQALHALVQKKGSRPKVIFFHDLRGCDRTGTLFAAYNLRYRNRSMTEAIAENELIARRHMSYKHQVAVQWYCESLVYHGLYTRGYDCGNCHPYRCQDTGDPWTFEHFVDLWSIVLIFGIIAISLSSRPCISWISSARNTGKGSVRAVYFDGFPPESYLTPPPSRRPCMTPPPLTPEGHQYSPLAP